MSNNLSLYARGLMSLIINSPRATTYQSLAEQLNPADKSSLKNGLNELERSSFIEIRSDLIYPLRGFTRHTPNSLAHIHQQKMIVQKAKKESSSVKPSLVYPVGYIVSTYQSHFPIHGLSKQLKEKIQDTLVAMGEQKRWNNEQQIKAWWDGIMDQVVKSDFLSGKSGKFSINLHWLMSLNNLSKIEDGAYASSTKKKSSIDDAGFLNKQNNLTKLDDARKVDYSSMNALEDI